ncbi:hypothetical protein [Reyranella sp. CPCC 100927]|uniref:hypothetical protein n=1 Tax=Reyranella sp. CPCC 100927 TaxID=2599616 RepID=UPI0011B5448E|nr:hypothetical protein [Reyranella sp. CPCC 100927]TWS99893.1 hypothetical protein FQU96_34405 [Reyranella sp. CPCC 100927]
MIGPDHRPARGLWDASRSTYVWGAVAAAVLSALLPAMWMWSDLSGSGRGAGLLVVVMALWAGALLLLVPLAAWVAWFMPTPGMPASLQWLRLTAVASFVSVVPLAVLLMVLNAIEFWLLMAPPIAILHGLWTALFLLGARR